MPEFITGAWVDLSTGHWHAVRGVIPELQGKPVLELIRHLLQGPGLRQLEAILTALRAGQETRFREVVLSAGEHLALVKVGERFPTRVGVFLFHATVSLPRMLSRTRMLLADLESTPP